MRLFSGAFIPFLLEVDIEKINTNTHEGTPVMRIEYVYQDGTKRYRGSVSVGGCQKNGSSDEWRIRFLRDV